MSTIFVMSKVVGYMITWTTYGSWLQGDERGYVKKGKILTGNEEIKSANVKLQKSNTVILSGMEKEIVRKTIVTEAEQTGQGILAIAVCSNHIHIIAEPCSKTIEEVVSRYKNKAMFELCRLGRKGRIWTRSFDKRFCFTKEQLTARIKYVKNHTID